jgi:hypothetical protein
MPTRGTNVKKESIGKFTIFLLYQIYFIKIRIMAPKNITKA